MRLSGGQVGQEPNIPLKFEDLPRAVPEPAAPARWAPQRPGDFVSPDEVPWGGVFGTPGPDTGFAYKIVKNLDLPGGAHRRSDIEAVLVAVMSARASSLGRAPTATDAAVAIELLDLTETSADSFAGIGHDHVRLGAVVEAIPAERLSS
jgi:hypothetical protein